MVELARQTFQLSGHEIIVTLFTQEVSGKTYIKARAKIKRQKLTYKELMEYWQKTHKLKGGD